MKRRIVTTLAIAAVFTHPSLADEVSPQTHERHAAPSTAAIVDVPAVAREAAATVDRFTAALASGDLTKAGAELDAHVLILESGGAERTAAEYLGGHAKGDAAFLKTAHQQLLRRTARVNGDFAWVASESELHLQRDGKPVTVLSTETMLLQRRASVWTIVHIHWSSRRKDPSSSH